MQSIAPLNETETMDAVREALARQRRLEIVSGGTKRKMGRAMEADRLLDLSALSGIVRYEPEELILTVRAATPYSEIAAALDEKGQMLAFAPADWGPLFGAARMSATLAGIAASNACGSRRVKSGPVRDHLIGCRFVNGMGEAIKAGGRVVKNVTGFDVPKLMCGAFGTLGALTELTFRVVPAPPRMATVAIRNCTTADGLALVRRAASFPLEPTGLAYLPAAACAHSPALKSADLSQTNGIALVRVEGAEDPVIDKIARLRNEFAKLDVTVLEDDESALLFAEIGDGAAFAEHDSAVWRLIVPPSAALAAVSASEANFWYADWAGEVLWLELPASREIDERLRKIAREFGGHAMLMRASSTARTRLNVFEPEPPARAALSRTVKAAFDPSHLFNPGRMFEDI